MKKVIGSVTALAALVLLSYYGTGVITERTIKKNLSLLDQANGLSAQITDYHRGLFSSRVNLSWKLLTPERFVKGTDDRVSILPAKTYTFEMPVTIHHGPVIYANQSVKFGLAHANSEVSIPKMYQAEFSNNFTAESVMPKLDLAFFVTYANKMLLHVDVPAFRLISKQDNSQFQWLGMKSEHSFSSNMNEVEGDVVIDGARFSQANHTASISKLTSTYDVHRSLNGLFLGDVTIQIPLFEVAFKDQKILDVQGIQLTTSSDVEEGLFASSFHAAFDKALMREKNYGPGRLSFSIKNLDAETLVDINKKMSDVQNGSDAARQQAALSILPELPKLFGKGATIDISEFNVVAPEGEVDGSVHIALPKSDSGNAFQLMQKVEGEGKFKFPETLLNAMMIRAEKARLLAQKQEPQETAESISKTQALADDASVPVPAVAPATNVTPPSADEAQNQAESAAKSRIANLIKVGAIVQKDTYYVINVKLAAGQISVNGHPLSAEMLQF